MTDIQERLRSVQTRSSQAAAARARAEVEVENAKSALDTTKAALKEEFGVVTGEDLRRVKAEIESELEAAVAEAEAQLDAAGA